MEFENILKPCYSGSRSISSAGLSQDLSFESPKRQGDFLSQNKLDTISQIIVGAFDNN